MPQYYLTMPTSVTLPANGAKIALTTACELHRDDSAVPNALAVANGAYNTLFGSDVTAATAAAPAAFRADYRGSVNLQALGTDGTFEARSATLPALAIGAAAERDELYVALSVRHSNVADPSTWSLAGQSISGTLLSQAVDTQASTATIWRFTGLTGNDAIAFTLTIPDQDSIRAVVAHSISALNAASANFVTSVTVNPAIHTQDLLADDEAFALVSFFRSTGSYADTDQITFTGMTKDNESHADPFNVSKLMNSALASFTGTTTETRVMSSTISTANRRAGISMRLRG